ncbi:MAG: NADPH-dependent FMN reductase [Candidatus Dormibacteraceae bacterium]
MIQNNTLQILAISGSLRRGSFNTALLREAANLAPTNMKIELYQGLRDIPPYDEDQRAHGDPESVISLKRQIAAADGLLIATPEYNGSVPGVLKNAIDWVSRPPEPPLPGKVVAVVGASMSQFGTMRAQLHLQDILTAVGALTMPAPAVLIGQAHERFTEDGRLTDQTSREFLTQLLTELARWVRLWAEQKSPVGV